MRVRLFLAALAIAASAFVTLEAVETFTKVYDMQLLDGTDSRSGLVRGSDNMLYGTINSGGVADAGTLFRYNGDGTITTLIAFGDPDHPVETFGAYPTALVRASDGNLYGTTEMGGSGDYGTIFRYSPAGGFESLYSFRCIFAGPASVGESGDPYGALTEGRDGWLYGQSFGIPGCGDGSVFKFNPAARPVQFTVLYTFNVARDGGGQTWGPVVVGRDGSVFGTTYTGVEGVIGVAGTVFKIPPQGGTLQILHVFAELDGSNPRAGVVRGIDGAMYGTTESGGDLGDRSGGTIFRITEDGSFSSVHTFDTAAPGLFSPGPEMLGSGDGRFLGSAQAGGLYDAGGVYEFDSTDGSYRVVYNFNDTPSVPPDPPNDRDGHSAYRVDRGPNGELIGTNAQGGNHDLGTIFGLTIEPPIETHAPFALAFSTPANTVEAQDAGGANVTLDASWSSDQDFDYPLRFLWSGLPGGATSSSEILTPKFPMGTTSVTLTVTETDQITHGPGKSSVTTLDVVVEDHTPPEVIIRLAGNNGPLPGNSLEVVIGGSSGPVNYGPLLTLEARDDVTASTAMPVTCEDPSSGDVLSARPEPYPVDCWALDGAKNKGETTFLLFVRSGLPTIEVPSLTVIVEATTPTGGPAFFDVSAKDANGVDLPSGAITCTKILVDVPDPVPVASGSAFPFGDTLVTCTATDGALSSNPGQFTVRVVDTTPPALIAPLGLINVPSESFTLPDDPVGGASVPFDPVPSARDLGQPVNVECKDNTGRIVISGSWFSIGTWLVTCTATDGVNPPSVKTFSVKVNDDISPVLAQHSDVVINGGSVVLTSWNFEIEATDNFSPLTVRCWEGTSPTPTGPTTAGVPLTGGMWSIIGMTFSVRITSVTCLATEVDEIYYPVNDNSNAMTFSVTVVDKVAPVLSLPANITAAAVGGGPTAVTFTATAVDAIEGPLPVSCSWPSGSALIDPSVPPPSPTGIFPVGETTVTCRATDSAGNSTADTTQRKTFTVTVKVGPTVTIRPAEIMVDATSVNGAVVSFLATAVTTAIPPVPVPVTCAWNTGTLIFPAGSLVQQNATFPIGVTNITCTAFDGSYPGSAILPIAVVDRPPVISVPANITINASALGTATISFFALATDVIDGPRAVTCSWGMPVQSVAFTPPSTSPKSGTFQGGPTDVVTTVTCKASDLPHPPGPAHPEVSTPFTVTVTPTMTIDKFVVFSLDQSWLREKVQVLSGDVGANNRVFYPSKGHGWDDDDWDDRDHWGNKWGHDADDDDHREGRHRTGAIEVRLGQGVVMLQPTSRVVGDTVRLQPRASVYNVHDNDLIKPNTATVLGTVTTGLSLPLLTMPAFPTITPGRQDIVVARNQTLTLNPDSYRSIQVKKNGTLVLIGPADGPGVYQVQNLDLDEGATVRVTKPVEIQIKGEFDAASRVSIINDPILAPSLKASQIIFYVSGADSDCRHGGYDDDDDEDHDGGPAVVHIGQRSVIAANIYAPGGTLWIKGNSAATGAFIGKRVRIGTNTQLTLDSKFGF